MGEARRTAAVHAWDNGRGLSRDLAIIVALLDEAGFDTTVVPVRRHERGAYHRAHLRRWLSRPRRDLNLFLESMVPAEFHRARRNVLIPNQEWFEPTDLRFLSLLDVVACRTEMACKIFANRGPRVEYIGFTSEDRSVPGVPKGDRILHIAGHSEFKGTAALLRVWQRHPEWPRLTLIHRATVAPVVTGAANIEQHIEHVPDDELRRLQQEAWLAVQPSEAEGFGHCLGEGMSTGAMVVTVDAPPMNELVGPDRGILVPFSGTVPMGMDHRYLVDEGRLEAALAGLFADGRAAQAGRMQAAREWYLANDAAFRRRFRAFFGSQKAP